MGLLSDSFDEDINSLRRVSSIVSKDWNLRSAVLWDVDCFVSEKGVEECCKSAEWLFQSGLPNPPGPFKRAAASVVLGRIHRLFRFFKHGTDEELDGSQSIYWLARLLPRLIPPILGILDIKDPSIKQLRPWPGFPTSHFRLEFLSVLRRLTGRNGLQANLTEEEWKEFHQERLKTITLFTSLVIESCYYNSLGDSFDYKNVASGEKMNCIKDLDAEFHADLTCDHFEISPDKNYDISKDLDAENLKSRYRPLNTKVLTILNKGEHDNILSDSVTQDKLNNAKFKNFICTHISGEMAGDVFTVSSSVVASMIANAANLPISVTPFIIAAISILVAKKSIREYCRDYSAPMKKA